MRKLLAFSIVAAASSQAGAFQLETGDDWNIRFDNTFKGNAMVRVAKQDPDVYAAEGLTAQLADDSDLSVDRGDFASTRFDVLSELDVIWRQNLGFRVSGSAWYDPIYNDSSNPKSGPLPNGFPTANSTWGQLSVNPNDYSDNAKKMNYAGGELLDAFVFANWNMGDMGASARAGRHTIYWGQSLLSNGALLGIAGSMAAIDIAKGWAVPGTDAKELFMPNNKVSSALQITDNFEIAAFYAFEHVVHRFPVSGTYWSPVEILTDDTEFLTFIPGPTRAGLRNLDTKYKDSGEWGMNLQYTIESWGLETSFVYISATDRATSGVYGSFGGVPEDEYTHFLAKSNAAIIGYFGWVEKNDIDVYGISLAKDIGGVSAGMDIVYREDAPLAPNLTSSLGGRTQAPSYWSSTDNYPGATGDVYSVVVNGLGFMNGDWGLWDGGKWVLEVTATWLDSYGENAIFAEPKIHEDRVVTSAGAVFSPTWYQVFPGWDMSLPMSLSYTIDGEYAPLASTGYEEIGSASIGVEFLINEVWVLTTRYNNFFGPVPNGTPGLLKDRDNVAVTVKRTF